MDIPPTQPSRRDEAASGLISMFVSTAGDSTGILKSNDVQQLVFTECKESRRDRVDLGDAGAISVSISVSISVPVCRHGQRKQLPHGHLQQAAAGRSGFWGEQGLENKQSEELSRCSCCHISVQTSLCETPTMSPAGALRRCVRNMRRCVRSLRRCVRSMRRCVRSMRLALGSLGLSQVGLDWGRSPD